MKLSFYRIWFFCAFAAVFLVAGCARVVPTVSPQRAHIADYQDLESFCEKNNLTYNFDTIDDIVTFTSPDIEIKILLNSLAAVANGSVVILKNPPLYSRGKILLPRELEQIIKTEIFIDFRPTLDVKTIAIDPGHGGKDPGAVSARGLKEKTVNLIIANILKRKLEAKGYNVIMTRNRDFFISLEERTEVVRRYNADLFISIHANANRSRNVSGVEIYYLNPNRLNASQRALKLSRTAQFANKPVSPEAAAILWDLSFTKSYSLSVEFSNILHFNFKKLGFSVKPPITSGFYVLRNAYAPAVLVETGYLSNLNEERALRKSYYQNQVAEAIMLSVEGLSRRYSLRR
jgi:N-acetylmuramoyl-L-alanine amidase